MDKTYIQVATPCHESWDAMTPTGTGRHCAACAKVVVDFTQQTDAEILAYLRQVNGSGKTCGRFRAGQLGRPLWVALPALPTARWQLWLAGLLVAALTTQSCQPTTLGELQPISFSPPQAAIDTVAAALDTATTYIDGRVVSSYDGQPVSQVRVSVVGTKLTTTTGTDGLFTFTRIPKTAASTPVTLHLVASDYPDCDFTLNSMPPPNQPLLVVAASVPVPTYLMGDVKELRDRTE